MTQTRGKRTKQTSRSNTKRKRIRSGPCREPLKLWNGSGREVSSRELSQTPNFTPLSSWKPSPARRCSIWASLLPFFTGLLKKREKSQMLPSIKDFWRKRSEERREGKGV